MTKHAKRTFFKLGFDNAFGNKLGTNAMHADMNVYLITIV